MELWECDGEDMDRNLRRRVGNGMLVLLMNCGGVLKEYGKVNFISFL